MGGFSVPHWGKEHNITEGSHSGYSRVRGQILCKLRTISYFQGKENCLHFFPGYKVPSEGAPELEEA